MMEDFSFAGERLQKGDKVLLFLGAQSQRGDGTVQVRVLVAAAIVIIDDFLQSRQAAAVHIRGRESDIAQRWRLESATVRVFIGDGESAQISRPLAPAYPGVVEALVGKIGAGMTAPAAAPTLI